MKKYVPSGYQIINIDLTDKTSGTAFTPETEDEQELSKLLTKHSNKEIIKPVLLTVILNSLRMTGFGVVTGGLIALTYGYTGSQVDLELWVDEDGELTFNYQED